MDTETFIVDGGDLNKAVFCVAQREAECSVCCDIAMCNSNHYRAPNCPHQVEIPLLLLQRSAQDTACQICHVLCAAIKPYILTISTESIARSVLIVREGFYDVPMLSWPIAIYTIAVEPPLLTNISSTQDAETIGIGPAQRVCSAELFAPLRSDDGISPSHDRFDDNVAARNLSRWYAFGLSKRRPIQKCAHDPEAIVNARQWLSTCLQEHDWCRKLSVRDAQFAPDRLIEVSSASVVRLSLDHPPNVKYLALSYCWGSSQFYCTTRENLDSHVDGIPTDSLPQTILDAITVTQLMGYNYIWIDSLCIIQEDKLDFAKQSNDMGNIYSHAIMVISADVACDVYQGFLQDRVCTTIINIPESKRNPRGLKNAGDMDERVHSNLDTIYARPHWGIDFHFCLDREPTYERAWCFQEQRLARRVLHFGQCEMYWECASLSACECGKYPGPDPSNFESRLFYHAKNQCHTYFAVTEAAHTKQIWWNIVESYYTRQLTIPADRLPAIAGLASRLKCAMLGVYHAGMWTKDMPRSLLFRVDGNKPSHNSAVFVGPSWSWISKSGGEFTEPPGAILLVDIAVVEGIQSSPRDDTNPFGAIQCAWIQITGPVLRATLSRARTGIVHGDRTSASGPYIRRSFMGSVCYLDEGHLEAHGRIGDPPKYERVWLLMIARYVKRERHNAPPTKFCLVLVESNRQQGAFVRIGVLVSYQGIRGRWRKRTLTLI